MKRNSCILMVMSGLLAFASTAAPARDNGISVSGVTLTATAEGPRLEMTVVITKNAVTDLQGVAVIPILSDGANSARFPHVLVNGRNRSRIYERHEKFRYLAIEEDPPWRVVNIDRNYPGGEVDYSASIPGEEWMSAAALRFELLLVSPAGERRSYLMSVAGTYPAAVPQAPAVAVPVAPPIPAGAIRTVSGTSDIDEAIGRIAAAPGAYIVSITLTGYSSPEGRYDANTSIARDRAAALSRRLQQRYGIAAGVIRIRAAGEDWSGLRSAVAESYRNWPTDVLEIIDSADAPDAKESRIKRLQGGVVWQRMERDIFPRLRKVDYSIDFSVAE